MKIEYDSDADTVTIEGLEYSGALLRHWAAVARAPGSTLLEGVFRIFRNKNGTLTFTREISNEALGAIDAILEMREGYTTDNQAVRLLEDVFDRLVPFAKNEVDPDFREVEPEPGFSAGGRPPLKR